MDEHRRVGSNSGASGESSGVPSKSMTYRDDQGALHGRVDALESELDAANRRIAELSGGASTSIMGDGEKLGPLSNLGTPTSLRIEQVLDGELTVEGYEAISSVIRERLGLDTTQVGGRMETLERARSSAGRVLVAVKEGKTHVVVERDWSERAMGTWVLTAMVALFGGVVVAALMHDLFRLSDAMSFVHVLWSAPLVAFVAASLLRPYARKKVEAELASRRGTFAAIVALAQRHSPPVVRTRVETANEAHESGELDDAPLEERAGSRTGR